MMLGCATESNCALQHFQVLQKVETTILNKNAKDILPHAVQDQTPFRRPGRGFGGKGGGEPEDPNDPYGGSPG
eukprot:4226494-Amphidinium_carterae.1